MEDRTIFFVLFVDNLMWFPPNKTDVLGKKTPKPSDGRNFFTPCLSLVLWNTIIKLKKLLYYESMKTELKTRPINECRCESGCRLLVRKRMCTPRIGDSKYRWPWIMSTLWGLNVATHCPVPHRTWLPLYRDSTIRQRISDSHVSVYPSGPH